MIIGCIVIFIAVILSKVTINPYKLKDIFNVARQYSNDVFVNGDANKKNIALTFDDGPDGKITPKILDILKQNNVKGN